MPSLVSSDGAAAAGADTGSEDTGSTDTGSTGSGSSSDPGEDDEARHVDELLGDAPRDVIGGTRMTAGTARRTIACVRGCLDQWRRQRLVCGRLRAYWILAHCAMQERLGREASAATAEQAPDYVD